MSTKLDRLSELAKEDGERQFFSIAHLITPEALYEAFRDLRKDASAGVDGVTYEEYEKDAAGNIQQFHQRLKDGKMESTKHPASAQGLYSEGRWEAEADLDSVSRRQDAAKGYGQGAECHLRAGFSRLLLRVPTQTGTTASVGRSETGDLHPAHGWILEIDITSYFDTIVREQLMEMVEKRISDGSVLQLIRKWIKVGVIEEGRLLVSETGTGQGQTISPLLANIFLHYVLDEWFEEVVKPRIRGEAHEIRFADDAVLCFQYREDAEKVLSVLTKRFAKYGLTLHPEKTRLLEFGREAEGHAKRQGKKPGTFDFLGLTHICTRSRRGKFTVHVRTMRKRLRRGLKAVAQWCQEHMHDPVDQQQKNLNAKLRGHYQYYGRPTNYRGIRKFYRRVRYIWRTWLNRRTRGAMMTWEKYEELLRQLPLLPPRIMHAWAQTGSPV